MVRIVQPKSLIYILDAKCEFLNPGGSLKDRIAHAMVNDATKTGRIQLGTRLVEPTSGNTGIGVSLTAAVSGNYYTTTHKIHIDLRLKNI